MCEFCTKHGEGKKWYLEMKNYSEILFNEELSKVQKKITKVNSRSEYIEHGLLDWIMPAMGAISNADENDQEVDSDEEESEAEFTDEEIVYRAKITHFGQVVPIEDVDTVIQLASSITRLPCGCRYYKTGQTNKRYCFGLGIDRGGLFGKYPEETASLEVLEKNDAKEIIHRYDEEGLIHTVWTGITPYVYAICNCDSDCGAYNSSYVEGNPSSFFRAEYISHVDWDQCSGCKECVSQCQFGAIHYSSTLGKVYIHPKMCFGCGVCRAACPNTAISLRPRQENEISQELWLARES